MRVRDPKVEAVVFCCKNVDCNLWVGIAALSSLSVSECFPQVRGQSCSNAGAVPDCFGKEEAEPGGKVFNLPVDLHSGPQLVMSFE